MGNYCVARPKTVAPCRPSTAVLHARNLQVAAKSESAADVLAEDVEPLQEYVAGDTLEVEAAAVADESLKIVNCNLSPSTVQALEKKGIHALFPIQKSVFDPAMAGQDLVARARTGSGKTLAFALPIIESILKEDLENGGARPRAPRALILAPTRELAKQVASELQSATNSQVRVLTVYGGTPLYSQIRQLNNGIDVLVGTPGRTIDLCQKRGELDLSAVRFFVLDEADEMLNMGFQEDVETVLESVPENRQTMMFSATMPQWVRKLAKKYATNHIMVDLVGEHDTGRVNSDVKCLACTTPPSLHAKRFLLVDLITLYSKAGKTIVFCNTKRECEAVVTAVSGIMPAEALHGDIAQDMREYTMNRFREGKTHVLVATDVAARGLDVNNVDLVVHWDVPSDSETYLHRSGRTGRAGNKGTAIVLIGQHDKGRVADIMRDVKVELELIGPPSPEQIIASAADNIKRSLSGTSIEVARFFEGTAKELLENGVGHAKEPAEVLATVMAQMSGYTELPKVKSLLGQQEGYVTLGVLTPKKMGFTSPGALIGAIRRITSDKVSGSIGKVELFDDIEDSGYEAAFDVPKEHAAAVIEASKENGAKVDELKSLPLDLKKLRNHRGGGDRGGRGGRWGGRGGGRGRGGGGGYNRDRSNNRGSYGSRGGGGYGGGGSYMDSRGGGGGYRGRSDGGGYNDRRQGGGYSRGYSSNSNRGGRSNYRDNDGGGYRGGNDSGYGGWGNSGGGGSKRREINTKRDFDSW